MKIVGILFVALLSIPAHAKGLNKSQGDVVRAFDESLIEMKFELSILSRAIQREKRLEACRLVGVFYGKGRAFDQVSRSLKLPNAFWHSVVEVSGTTGGLQATICSEQLAKPEDIKETMEKFNQEIDRAMKLNLELLQ